jgi:sulfite oxidase
MSESTTQRLHFHSNDPLVGGPSLVTLREDFVTPTDLFFVRNHAPVPTVAPAEMTLEVDGRVQRPLRLPAHRLGEHFPRVTLTATLMCAGNRRNELARVAPIPGEVPWSADGISTATWSGVRLADVLEAAGVADGAAHVAFEGIDQVTRHERTFGFGGSIPLEKALGVEVLLADEMNGAALPPVHGFPLRVVVSGWIGARSVKWLKRITVQSRPSDNYFQSQAYRLFPTNATPQNVAVEDGLMLGENSLNAVICSPESGASMPAGSLAVRGYAIAGGERRVARVDVSGDGGSTWTAARLEGDERWAWQFFEARLAVSRGPTELVARAYDTAANTQPERLESVWNFKGYMNNAWHRVPVRVG